MGDPASNLREFYTEDYIDPQYDVNVRQVKEMSHPLANAFPMLVEEGHDQEGWENYNSFKQSMYEHGQLINIVMYKGQIIDGRNRYYVCLELGIDPKTEEYTGPESSIPDYIWGSNVTRRHIPQGQRAAIWLKFNEHEKAILEAKAKERLEARTGGVTVAKLPPSITKGKSRKFMAKKAGVSERTMQNAISLLDKDPQKFNAVAYGDVSLGAALVEADTIERGEGKLKTDVSIVHAKINNLRATIKIIEGYVPLTPHEKDDITIEKLRDKFIRAQKELKSVSKRIEV